MTIRITLRTICVSTFVMAAIGYLYVGFEEHFDVFGFYGRGWTVRNWMAWGLLAGWLPVVLVAQWWADRKRAVEPKRTDCA